MVQDGAKRVRLFYHVVANDYAASASDPSKVKRLAAHKAPGARHNTTPLSDEG